MDAREGCAVASLWSRAFVASRPVLNPVARVLTRAERAQPNSAEKVREKRLLCLCGCLLAVSVRLEHVPSPGLAQVPPLQWLSSA